MDRYRRVNKWQEDKERECAFCHSKLSVKYDVQILVPSDGGAKETWLPCCNVCVALCVWGGVIRPFLFYYRFSNELKSH